jgi:hypothetical protein
MMTSRRELQLTFVAHFISTHHLWLETRSTKGTNSIYLKILEKLQYFNSDSNKNASVLCNKDRYFLGGATPSMHPTPQYPLGAFGARPPNLFSQAKHWTAA